MKQLKERVRVCRYIPKGVADENGIFEDYGTEIIARGTIRRIHIDTDVFGISISYDVFDIEHGKTFEYVVEERDYTAPVPDEHFLFIN